MLHNALGREFMSNSTGEKSETKIILALSFRIFMYGSIAFGIYSFMILLISCGYLECDDSSKWKMKNLFLVSLLEMKNF